MEQQSARHLASFGRYGDTELLHVNKAELAGLASLAPGGELPTNPVTGLPEAFFFLPFLAGLGGIGAGAAAAATSAAIPAMTAASLAPAVGGLGALGASMMTPLASGAAGAASGLGAAAGAAGELAGAAGAIAPAASAAGELAGLGGLAGGVPANVASTLAPAAELATAGSGSLTGSASALAPELAAASPEALAAGAGPAQQAALAGPASNIGAVSPELVNQVALAGPAGQIGPAATPAAEAIAATPTAELATLGTGPVEAGGSLAPAGAEFGPEAATAAGEVGATGVGEGGLFQSLGGGMDMSTMMQALAPLAMMMGGGGDGKKSGKKGKVATGWEGGSAEFPGEDYEPGIDNEWEYYNNGGLIKGYQTGGPVQQPMEPVMQQAGPPVGGGLATLMAPPMMDLPDAQMDSPYNGDMEELTAPQPGDDQLIEAMTAVLMGEVPPPQDDAITGAFLQTFGEEALKDLASRVQAMSSGAGGPAPDGINDAIPALIDGERPAKLSSGEFVIPSDAVAHAGNGDTGAGSKRLQEMVDNLRLSRTGTNEQPPEIDPYMMMPS